MARLIDRDVLSGLAFALFGAAGLLFGGELAVGTAGRMGPGFMPVVLSWALILLGAVVALRSLWRQPAPIEALQPRALGLITLAILAFALLVERGGLLLAGSALIALGTFAGPEFRWRECLVLTAGLLALSAGLFIHALELSITLLPR
ncbi:MAG: tripartite tricarboxylate transporter TctB family protein [Thalassobaculales bacterium]